MEDLYLLRRTFPSTDLKDMFIPLIWLYLASKAGETRRRLLLLQSVQDREELDGYRNLSFVGILRNCLFPGKAY